MVNKGYDFCGYVTRNDLECSDGRVIRRDAFAHQDGEKVPLAWNHKHDTPDACLGYTILENRPDGVYGYSYLNDSEKANQVRELVRHGDIDSYSIFANRLKQVSNQVFGGDIKEVSLVWSGANPGAYIEDVSFAHGDDPNSVQEAIIYVGDTDMEFNDKSLRHSDMTVDEIVNSFSPEQVDLVMSLLDQQEQNIRNESDDDEEYDDVDYDEEYDSDYDEDYDEEDYDDEYDEEYELEHSGLYDDEYYDYEGDETMKNNIFDGYDHGNVLTHSDFLAIKEDAARCGSFKEAYRSYIEDGNFMAHSAESDAAAGISRHVGTSEYGFNDPDMLFPDYKALDPTPMWIKRDTGWVAEFWGKIHRVPFARVKSLYADITEDAARAKGYIKGNLKKEEVFTTMKRVTDPTTVYKKQKLDKQDIDDITDFDVVAWIRAEMRVMLNEEIARAALIGDGRSAADPDKINPLNIRPIYLDDEFYTIRYDIVKGNPDETAKNIIRGAVKARKNYKGSGNTTWFTTEDFLTDCLLLEDNIGHRLYKTEAELCAAMRVSRIVTVEVMENLTNPNNGKLCAGIIVNPTDYTVGANKGGNIDMFDDFDIDYNQYKYLLETRCSGALQKYHSAIVLELVDSNPSQA